MDEYLHSYNFKVALWLRSQCGFMVSGYMFYSDGYRKLEMSDGGGQYLQPCGATRFTTKLIKHDATFGEDRPLSAGCSSQTLRYDSRCVSSSHSNCNCAWKVVHAESLQETPDYL